MTRRTALICLLVGTVAVSVVLLVLPPRNVISTPGGGELELLGVTCGTINYCLGRGLKDRLLRFLPKAIARNFHSRGARMSATETNVVFWFDRSGDDMPIAMVCDADSGLGIARPSCTLSTGTDDGWVEGLGFSAVPRRKKDILLRLYASTVSNEAGALLREIKVPNPLWGNYPTWTPEALPTTRETNGLSISLHELENRRPLERSAGARANGSSH
jgi:hypothetical protein